MAPDAGAYLFLCSLISLLAITHCRETLVYKPVEEIGSLKAVDRLRQESILRSNLTFSSDEASLHVLGVCADRQTPANYIAYVARGETPLLRFVNDKFSLYLHLVVGIHRDNQHDNSVIQACLLSKAVPRLREMYEDIGISGVTIDYDSIGDASTGSSPGGVCEEVNELYPDFIPLPIAPQMQQPFAWNRRFLLAMDFASDKYNTAMKRLRQYAEASRKYASKTNIAVNNLLSCHRETHYRNWFVGRSQCSDGKFCVPIHTYRLYQRHQRDDSVALGKERSTLSPPSPTTIRHFLCKSGRLHPAIPAASQLLPLRCILSRIETEQSFVQLVCIQTKAG